MWGPANSRRPWGCALSCKPSAGSGEFRGSRGQSENRITYLKIDKSKLKPSLSFVKNENFNTESESATLLLKCEPKRKLYKSFM